MPRLDSDDGANPSRSSGQPTQAAPVPPPPSTGAARELWNKGVTSFPSAGFKVVGAFFALAEHAYDEPAGGCTPPPLVPMVYHGQLPSELKSALVAVMQMTALLSDTLRIEDLMNVPPPQVPVAGLPVFVGLTHNDDDSETVRLGVLLLRKLLSVDASPPIDAVLSSGVLPRLVQLLGGDSRIASADIVFEAAWAITNIASGTHEHTRHVVDAGAVPHFVTHVRRRTSEDIVEQCVWALGNIAGDSVATRDVCIAGGAVDALADCITGAPFAKITVLRNAVWAACNLCRAKPSPPLETVLPLLHAFGPLLSHADKEVVADAAWGVSYITDGTNDRIQAAVDAGVVPCLVALLGRPAHSLITPALRALGNVVTGTDDQTNCALANGLLAHMPQLLQNLKTSIVKEACWTLSNITAGTSAQIQLVIDANLFPALVTHLQSSVLAVKKEATWAIANATSGGTPQQLEYLQRLGVVQKLFGLATLSDQKVVKVALEALRNIVTANGRRDGDDSGPGAHPCAAEVAESGGLETLEGLQEHANTEIVGLAQEILTLLGVVDDDA